MSGPHDSTVIGIDGGGTDDIMAFAAVVGDRLVACGFSVEEVSSWQQPLPLNSGKVCRDTDLPGSCREPLLAADSNGPEAASPEGTVSLATTVDRVRRDNPPSPSSLPRPVMAERGLLPHPTSADAAEKQSSNTPSLLVQATAANGESDRTVKAPAGSPTLASMAFFALVDEREGCEPRALVGIDGGTIGPIDQGFRIDEHFLDRHPSAPQFVKLQLRALLPLLECLGHPLVVGADFVKAGVGRWSVPSERHDGLFVGHENSPSSAVATAADEAGPVGASNTAGPPSSTESDANFNASQDAEKAEERGDAARSAGWADETDGDCA